MVLLNLPRVLDLHLECKSVHVSPNYFVSWFGVGFYVFFSSSRVQISNLIDSFEIKREIRLVGRGRMGDEEKLNSWLYYVSPLQADF